MAVTEDDFFFLFIDAPVVSVCSEQDANLISFLVKQQFGFEKSLNLFIFLKMNYIPSRLLDCLELTHASLSEKVAKRVECL